MSPVLRTRDHNPDDGPALSEFATLSLLIRSIPAKAAIRRRRRHCSRWIRPQHVQIDRRHVVVALFATIAAVELAHHEMWLDELNPWDIARDARSLGELFYNARFEPHPR